jgi:hypothetical protein
MGGGVCGGIAARILNLGTRWRWMEEFYKVKTAYLPFTEPYLAQTGSGAYLASYPLGAGGTFPWDKAAGAWSWPLNSIYCRGQEWWSYISTSPYVFMVWCLIN